MNSGLPKGWSICSLGQIVDVVGGGTPSKSNPSFWIDGTIPWVSPKDMKTERIKDAEDHITSEGLLGSSANLIPKCSVLVVTRSGILANALPVAITDREVAINQDIKALIPREGISAEYIAYALRRFETKILRECSKSGTTVQSILTPRLMELKIPLAPTSEQIRINARIDSALDNIDGARTAVRAITSSLEKYRSIVLTCAMNGQATQKWREEIAVDTRNENELASALASSNLAQAETVSAFGIDPNARWSTATLEGICTPDRSITYGIIQTGEPTRGGVPTVRAGDIKNFSIEIASLKKVRQDIAAQYPRTLLQGGEVLVSIRGTTGNVAVTPQSMKGMNISREVAVIPVKSNTNPHFVAYALASPAGQAIINANIKGIAQSGINLSDLRNFSIPLPSLSEQNVVVKFIEDAFAKIDQIQQRQNIILAYLDELTKAVFVKAFAGELTFQSKDDEPVNVLLKRVATRSLSAKADAQERRRSRIAEKRKTTRRSALAQTRKDVNGTHLLDIITDARVVSMPVKELFLRAEMDVDEFYKQLALEISSGTIHQTDDKSRLELSNAP
ncbi:MAG: restriction endonuclease subunit S [Rhizobium rhizophilum]|uniref:restriction endonuclease subunit S n=1 Tax=Rhizobium rhizophilum TaxID=1850373 RepID=UPI00391C687D